MADLTKIKKLSRQRDEAKERLAAIEADLAEQVGLSRDAGASWVEIGQAMNQERYGVYTWYRRQERKQQ